MKLTVIISCGGSSYPIIDRCVKQLSLNQSIDWNAILIAPETNCEGLKRFCYVEGNTNRKFSPFYFDSDMEDFSSQHSDGIDSILKKIKSPYFMTLDSDCWALDSSWYESTMASLLSHDIVGIGHTYANPGVLPVGIEKRIREAFAYDNPHVACLAFSKKIFNKIGLDFGQGDDTGLGIIKKAKEMGVSIYSEKPKGCLCPDYLDYEFNREKCIIYDKWIHLGGASVDATRTTPWTPIFYKLIDDFTFETKPFKFNREEDVADKMVARITNGMRIHLQTNTSLFRS